MDHVDAVTRRLDRLAPQITQEPSCRLHSASTAASVRRRFSTRRSNEVDDSTCASHTTANLVHTIAVRRARLSRAGEAARCSLSDTACKKPAARRNTRVGAALIDSHHELTLTTNASQNAAVLAACSHCSKQQCPGAARRASRTMQHYQRRTPPADPSRTTTRRRATL